MAGKEGEMSDNDGTGSDDTAMSRAFDNAGYTAPGIDASSGDEREPRHYASPTAAICDHAALYGATPGPDEPDNRMVWSEAEAVAALEQTIHSLIENVAPDGTQLADERESLLWGFVNMLHAQAGRIDRTADKIVLEMRDLERAQDGTEVKAVELERLTERARNLGDRRDAFETMRDFAADAYRVETGNVWRPRQGSHTSRTGRLTNAAGRHVVGARHIRDEVDLAVKTVPTVVIHRAVDQVAGSVVNAEQAGIAQCAAVRQQPPIRIEPQRTLQIEPVGRALLQLNRKPVPVIDVVDLARHRSADRNRAGRVGPGRVIVRGTVRDISHRQLVGAGAACISAGGYVVDAGRVGTQERPHLWFRGFASQGDGASFEASYAHAKGATGAIRAHAPKDTTLHRIFDGAMPEQCIVNEYRPGQGIGMHADHSSFGDVVISLSLADAWTMNFRPRSARPYVREGMASDEVALLPRRSALVLRGSARSAFMHGIDPAANASRSETRVSATFRTLGA